MELRLDDYARALIKWLTNDYKLLPDTWKNPQVVFKGFDGDKAVLQLWFHVDNIRLEHDGRLQRITTDIARHVQEKFSSEAKWI